jgi:hypothetical protein
MAIDPNAGPVPQSSEHSVAELENARAGYQAAVSLMAYEGNLVWARYGLMVLVHTIILTAIGLTSGAQQLTRTVTMIGLSLVGLMLCAVWWRVNDIGFHYFFYWLFAARELEERYLTPVQTLSRGIPSKKNEATTFILFGKEYPSPAQKEDRFRIKHASKAVIIIIGLLYVALVTVLLKP